MREQAAIAVDVHGDVLRYVEVGHHEGTFRLRRAGRRTVDGNVATALLGDDPADATLSVIAETLGDALASTDAGVGRLVVHPPDVCSFFVPVAADAPDPDRTREIRRQAALATGARSADALHLVSTAVRTTSTPDGPAEWVHVLAVPQAAQERLRRITDAVSVEEWGWTLSSAAAGPALGTTETGEERTGYDLLVGQYDAHTEFSVVRGEDWIHAAHADETTPNTLMYFAAGLLNRVSVPRSKVRGLRVYGEAAAPNACAPLQRLVGVAPSRLDPLHDVEERAELGAAVRSALVPCVGAARAALTS